MYQRRIVFVIFDGFQSLDLTGPLEVFMCAGRASGGYCCQIVAPRPGPVRAGSELVVHAGHGVADLDPSGIDTLVVTGGGGVDRARHDPALVGWIAAAGAGVRRLTSVCSGVFLLARGGWSLRYHPLLLNLRPRYDVIILISIFGSKDIAAWRGRDFATRLPRLHRWRKTWDRCR